MSVADLKQEARRIFLAALQRVDVRVAMRRSLRMDKNDLYAANTLYDLSAIQQIVIVALGKAATPMYEAAAEIVQTSGWPATRILSIVVSPAAPQSRFGDLTFFAGSHPMPGTNSRKAALHILNTLERATSQTLVLFLVSGGASAMVEVPLDPAISEEDLTIFNRVLVGSGMSISEINVLRKHLSAVKGGRLAQAAAPAVQCTLVLSDVPPGALQMVGSGPSLPNLTGGLDCHELYQRLRSSAQLPKRVEAFFASGDVPALPGETDPAFARAAWACLLSSEDLAAAAAHVAASSGFQVEIDNTCDEATSEDAASYLLARSRQLARAHTQHCLISVGEVSVKLPQVSGRGGRNQHFALQCALALAEGTASTTVLSAGSDGIDGNSPAAGAVADGETCRRARECGIDPPLALKRFDSFALFDALGDTILTGHTGNNLRDLRLLLT